MLHTSLYILAMGYFNKAKKKKGGGNKKAKEKNQQKKNSAESNSVNKYYNL